jgi:catechol 2,3-dioxygenase-like lactoylglutathione lyase family enzyme
MHMGHVALRVAALDRTTTWYRDTLGLKLTAESPGEVLLTANEKHHELQLLSGEQTGLDHIGIEVDTEAELDSVRERSIAAGAVIVEDTSAEEGLTRAFRMVGPSAMVFEIYYRMARQPISIPLGLRTPIRRFGHVTVLSPDPPPIVRFLVDGLGFRISDTLGSDLTWLRCHTDHHGIAVHAGPTAAVHHFAFEVTDWNGLRDFLDGVALRGGQAAYGPVRHGPGFSLSAYLADPDGCLFEAYTELLQIEANHYRAMDWSTVENPRNLWGPRAQPTFLEFGVPILAPR